MAAQPLKSEDIRADLWHWAYENPLQLQTSLVLAKHPKSTATWEKSNPKNSFSSMLLAELKNGSIVTNLIHENTLKCGLLQAKQEIAI